MNADRLLALYDRVAEAPDAIARARRFVLDLAVRGKLVEQNPTDEPALELSMGIAQEGIGASDPPRNWCHATVGDVLYFQYGKGLKASERTEDGPVPVYGSNGIVGYTTEPLTVRPSVIVGRKGSAGALNNCIGPSWTTDVAYFVEAPDFFDLDYLFLSLAALDLNALGKGVKPGLSRADAYRKFICIPPLAEQHRIVAKIDELMTLCDRLEEAQIAREDTRDRLTKASLSRLSAPDTDDATFRSHARFAIDALPALTARADQVKQFRETILNLAIRGKLVRQDPTDEAVEILLRAIRSKRDALVKSGKQRRTRPLGPVPEGEAPFDIPRTWIWVRVGEIALFAQYGTSSKAVHSDEGVPVLTMGNIQDGAIIRIIEKKLPENAKEFPKLFLKKFDLLYNRTNSAELVGKTGIYLGDDDRLTFASYLIRIRLSLEHTAPRFINFAMNAPDFRETQIVPHIKKQTGQANVSGSTLSNMLIPLPPLAEQRRIVDKVDELMSLCDGLEAALAVADTTRSNLLQTIFSDMSTPVDPNRHQDSAIAPAVRLQERVVE